MLRPCPPLKDLVEHVSGLAGHAARERNCVLGVQLHVAQLRLEVPVLCRERGAIEAV
jgi:hypothetical protein